MDPALASGAIVAGILTFFSPCSFPMLPAYLTFYLGIGEDREGYRKTFRRGVLNGLLSTAAFILVFSVFGVLTSVFSEYINPYMRYIEPAVGVALIVLGALFAAGKSFSLHIGAADPKKGVFSFSLLYALASVGCALPVFISMILFAVTSGGFYSAFVIFMLYALGMGAMMTLINLLLASAKQGVINSIRKNIGLVRLVSAAFMMCVGVYLIYYYFTVWVV